MAPIFPPEKRRSSFAICRSSLRYPLGSFLDQLTVDDGILADGVCVVGYLPTTTPVSVGSLCSANRIVAFLPRRVTNNSLCRYCFRWEFELSWLFGSSPWGPNLGYSRRVAIKSGFWVAESNELRSNLPVRPLNTSSFFLYNSLHEIMPEKMDSEILRDTSPSEAGAMPALTQVPTSVTLSAEQFEKLYLSPMMHRQPAMAKNLGNPTPLYAMIISLFVEQDHCILTVGIQGNWSFRAYSHTTCVLSNGMERCRWRWCCILVRYNLEESCSRSSLTYHSGVSILFGGLLLVLSSILEFVLGNTFSSVVFGHLGKLFP